MDYKNLILKEPQERSDYKQISDNVIESITHMVKDSFDSGNNKIEISTNIRGSFPLDNINKIAAPLIEAWAADVFRKIKDDKNNFFNLINVQVGTKRTDLADIVLQFHKSDNGEYSTANIDVKSTTDSIRGAGKSPNITSFAKIRTAYIEDPDFIFVVLSIKYYPYAEEDSSGFGKCIVELRNFKAYDFKYLSEDDFGINPALGTGQIQIKDIHYVEITPRTTWDLVKLLDDKYIASKKHTFKNWEELAVKNEWIKLH